MNVKEIREILKNYPPEAEVVMDSGDGEEYYHIDDIEGESEYKYGEIKRVWLK